MSPVLRSSRKLYRSRTKRIECRFIEFDQNAWTSSGNFRTKSLSRRDFWELIISTLFHDNYLITHTGLRNDGAASETLGKETIWVSAASGRGRRKEENARRLPLERDVKMSNDELGNTDLFLIQVLRVHFLRH